MPDSTTLIEGPLTQADVFAVIGNERDYQDAVWCAATTPTEGKHSPTEFLVYIQHYLNKGLAAASTNADPKANVLVLDNLRKVAALAVSAMEQNGAVARDPSQFPKVEPLPYTPGDDEIPF